MCNKTLFSHSRCILPHKGGGWTTLFAEMTWNERYGPEGHWNFQLLESQASCYIPGRGPPTIFKVTQTNKKAQLFQWKLICNNLLWPKNNFSVFLLRNFWVKLRGHWETRNLNHSGSASLPGPGPLPGCVSGTQALQFIDFGVKIKPVIADWSRGQLIIMMCWDRFKSLSPSQPEAASESWQSEPCHCHGDPCQWSASTFEDLESTSTQLELERTVSSSSLWSLGGTGTRTRARRAAQWQVKGCKLQASFSVQSWTPDTFRKCQNLPVKCQMSGSESASDRRRGGKHPKLNGWSHGLPSNLLS